MCVLTFQNPSQVGQLIRDSHGDAIKTQAMFDDFCAIGSFLSDEPLCLQHLAQLNESLVAHAMQLKVLGKMTTFKPFGESKQLVKKGKVEHEGIEYAIHKHYKVLTSFLTDFEAKAGFNTGSLPPDPTASKPPPKLPAKPPSLTTFVPVDAFRTYLLKYAYHWKDAGVGVRHGEFTHRIQWYMVLMELKDKPDWLAHKPIELFRACALPVWRHANDSAKGVWDDVFDDNTPTSFRRPETLHQFLKDAADPKHKHHQPLWMLAQLISGRAAKRVKEKTGTIEVPEDATTVADKAIMWKSA